jgi:copper chaperone CopZ
MMGVGIMTAIASSLCCITPLIAIVAGSTSLASTFQWIEPFRPWLIGATVLALGLAWYLKLKPVKEDDCGCDVVKSPFWNGKPFLSLLTVVSALMLTLPLYADMFYSDSHSETLSVISQDTIGYVHIEVEGMTCSGCEAHVEHAVKELPGVVQVEASFKDAKATVKYDPTLTNIDSIKEAISLTNYKVGKHKKVKL